MKKKIKLIIFGTVISLTVLIIGYSWWQHIRIQNVFDEIYCAELSDFNDNTVKGLQGMPQIEKKNSGKTSPVAYDVGILEKYKASLIDTDSYLSISFIFSKNQMTITYGCDVNAEMSYRIEARYNQKNKKLEEEIYVFDNNKRFITKSNDVREYLDKYNISKEFLQKREREILYNTLIKNWTEYYDSRFSIDNIGTVKNQKDEFLK